jgi:scyllo-inositol 2-dehydrogenase (NADP+)
MSRLRLRYLVVGYGNIGAKRKAVLGERCVGTVDPLNPVADFRTPQECARERYDAAILAVPNDAKLELMQYFLERGKPVLVEKPLLLKPERAGALAAIAARTGAVWYTAYNFRFEPHVLGLKRPLEAGEIGRLYRARLFYGNGTVGNIAGTWRDSGYGVLEDMASHLIDLTGYVFGKPGCDFEVWDLQSHELKVPDHCVLASADHEIVIECSFLSWKNRWLIEVMGERGSIEMNGLAKWGTSELIVRRRRFPSGPPNETREVVGGPDPTWEAELEHFESEVAAGRTSCDNDVWISRSVMRAAADALA